MKDPRVDGQLLCGMSAFKAHCGFGFWHPLMREHDKSLEGRGQFGKIGSLGDLPSAAAFRKLATKARKLVDDGVKGPPRPKAPKNRTVAVPADLKTRSSIGNTSAELQPGARPFSFSHAGLKSRWA